MFYCKVMTLYVEQMKTEKKQRNWRNALTAGALGIASLTSTAHAQEALKLDTTPAKLELRLRNAVVERQGFTTQNDFTYTKGDYTLKGLVEVLPDAKEANYGLDLTNKDFRLNVGYGDRAQDDVSRFAFTYYPEHDTSKSFIGANVQFLEDTTQFVAIGGFDLEDKLRLEGTFDNEGAARLAFFPKLADASLGIGVGRTADGDVNANFSYNTDNVWANFKFGQNTPLDARLIIGDIDPNFSRYISSVTGQGDNELDTFADQTLKFDIANGFFNHYGVGYFLGKEKGDLAFEFRYQEDKRIKANVGYRIGDVGPFKGAAVLGGVYRDLGQEINGVTGGVGFKIGDSPALFKINADVNERESTLGAFLELRF